MTQLCMYVDWLASERERRTDANSAIYKEGIGKEMLLRKAACCQLKPRIYHSLSLPSGWSGNSTPVKNERIGMPSVARQLLSRDSKCAQVWDLYWFWITKRKGYQPIRKRYIQRERKKTAEQKNKEWKKKNKNDTQQKAQLWRIQNILQLQLTPLYQITPLTSISAGWTTRLSKQITSEMNSLFAPWPINWHSPYLPACVATMLLYNFTNSLKFVTPQICQEKYLGSNQLHMTSCSAKWIVVVLNRIGPQLSIGSTKSENIEY